MPFLNESFAHRLISDFRGCPVDRFSQISIPQNVVIQLEPNQYGWSERFFSLNH